MLGAVRAAVQPLFSSAEPEPGTDDVTTAIVRGVDLDDVFEVLGNSRRRLIIRYLVHEADGDTATKRELAGHIAAVENEKPVDDLSAQERKRVYITLHQSHLGTMVEADVIEYDDRDTSVTATPATQVAARMLENADGHFNGGGA